jgi:hypothetical protein
MNRVLNYNFHQHRCENLKFRSVSLDSLWTKNLIRNHQFWSRMMKIQDFRYVILYLEVSS